MLEADGAGRFADVAGRWSTVAASALADDADGPAGSGLIALGGFAFAPDGGGSPRWEGFAPASLVVPELSLARAGDRVSLTVNVEVAPDDTLEDLSARVAGRLGELRTPALPLLDPAPAGEYKVLSPMPPSHYEEAVARAVERIRAGELEKIVLAREVEVHAPVDHDVGAVLGLLREAFASCYVFAVGRGDAVFLAASPELLVRRRGAAGFHRRARGLLAAERRSGGRRAPRRAAAAQRQGPRGERDRRAPDRSRAAASLGVGDGRARAGAGPGREHHPPRNADPRPAGCSPERDRAGRSAPPDAGRRRRAAARSPRR